MKLWRQMAIIDKKRLAFFLNTLIGLAILIGIFFRFEHLDRKLIWHDEVGTRLFVAGLKIDDWNQILYTGRPVDVEVVRNIHKQSKGALDTIKGLIRDDPQHPPLYYILAGAWIHSFGDDIGTLRLLSALISLLCLPAMYWFCLELFNSRRIAWIGTALIAVSPFFVLYAQEAREYTLWFVLILLSNAAFLRSIRLTENGEPLLRLARSWLLFSLITVLSLYTSLTTVSVMIVQSIYILIREHFRMTRILLLTAGALALSSVFFLPWMYALLLRWEAFQISMSWSSVIVIPNSSLLEILALNMSRPVIDFWPDRGGLPAFIGISISSVLAIWAVIYVIRRPPQKSVVLILSLIFIPILMLLGPDLLFGGIRSVSARYLAPSLIGLLVSIAYLLSAENERDYGWIRYALFPIVIGIGVMSCFHNARQEVVWTKGISFNLPKAAQIINEARSPLVVGNRERHHPGNLLALSYLLKPETKMQFLATEENYLFPQPFTVFLYSPTDQFRQALEKKEKVRTRLLFQDLHLELWIVEPLQ